MVAHTGETFASRKIYSKEVYETFLHEKSVDSLTEDMDRLDTYVNVTFSRRTP